jgi:hypothetical protein
MYINKIVYWKCVSSASALWLALTAATLTVFCRLLNTRTWWYVLPAWIFMKKLVPATTCVPYDTRVTVCPLHSSIWPWISSSARVRISLPASSVRSECE